MIVLLQSLYFFGTDCLAPIAVLFGTDCLAPIAVLFGTDCLAPIAVLFGTDIVASSYNNNNIINNIIKNNL